MLVNVNFPELPAGKTSRASRSPPRADAARSVCSIDAREDGRGNAYYWIAYVRTRATPPDDGTDISALAGNRIAVTPLRLDMTDEPFMTKLADLFG